MQFAASSLLGDGCSTSRSKSGNGLGRSWPFTRTELFCQSTMAEAGTREFFRLLTRLFASIESTSRRMDRWIFRSLLVIAAHLQNKILIRTEFYRRIFLISTIKYYPSSWGAA